ncbi:MAG: vWA domain-containing protein [Planctomycetaceae bacterium]
MSPLRQVSSFLVSLAAHAAALSALHFLFTLEKDTLQTLLPFDSVVEDTTEERLDFEQKLNTEETPATTLSTMSGAVSTEVGGASKVAVNRQTVEVKSDLTKFDAPFLPSDVNTPATSVLNVDVGVDGGIHGSTQMLVKDYGQALDKLTWELLRLMRRDKLLVVWLFDESISMKDDQEQIKKRIGKVFQELRIVDRDAAKTGISKRFRKSAKTRGSLLKEMMLTSIASFGSGYHPQTKTPTAGIPEILAAIERIPVDKTGKEYLCHALVEVFNRHKLTRARTKRKLVVIVISDESGDDGVAVETVLKQAKVLKAPIYILGRESVFGSWYAHVRWRQPETGRLFYLRIRRGPETPFPELLQHDGFRRRYDAHMSGFGPYAQVRLCRETNGVFFQLPYEQQDLNDFDDVQYAALAMQEFKPDLDARPQYAFKRNRSKFRKAIWDAIVMLNPYDARNKGLEIHRPNETFSTNPAKFLPRLANRTPKILGMLRVFERAIRDLERVKPLRDLEPSRRWRANYDLILAQLRWYQLRLFEYGIGLEQFMRKDLRDRLVKNPKHNRWRIHESGRWLILPDARNQKRFGVTPEELKQKYQAALEQLAWVANQYPGTPWAKRAKWESRRPFGVRFQSYYQPPAPPGQPRKPRPKPTKPPIL